MHPHARDLRVMMADHNLSLADTARLLGQGISTISRWRNGAPPPPEWMLRLLRYELAAKGADDAGEDSGRPEQRAA